MGSGNLPVPRVDAAGFSANGGLYLVGRHVRRRHSRTSSTGRFRTTRATFPSGSTSTASDLPPPGIAGGAAVVSGSNVFLIGGRNDQGVFGRRRERTLRRGRRSSSWASSVPRFRPSRSRVRSASSWATSPRPARARSTSPLLVIIGWAYAHPEKTRELLENHPQATEALSVRRIVAAFSSAAVGPIASVRFGDRAFARLPGFRVGPAGPLVPIPRSRRGRS